MKPRVLVAFVSCVLACGSLGAQQRDSPSAATTGAGAIRGQIVSDGDTPRPIRRAVVTLTGDLVAARAAITDDEGRFTFAGLPPGRYTISAKKAAYLPAAYGATRPGRPGTALSLARDQQATITIRMSRGAVLAGIVTDANGRPAAGVAVTATSLKAAPNAPAAGSAATDDRGQYRVFSLLPGEYVVSAKPSLRGAGVIRSPSTTEMDALLAEIARRSSAPTLAATAPTPAPLPMTARPIAFAPVFFPGTSIPQEAAPVKVAAGEERAGLDFSLRPVGVSTVEGVVSGPVANLGVVQISITPAGVSPQGLMSSSDANPILEERPSASDGRFKFTNVVPGRYTIMARADRNQSAPEPVNPGTMRAGSGGGISPIPANADYLYAVAEFDTRGDDIGGLALNLQSGGVFAGTIALDSAAAASQDLTKAAFRLNPWPSGSTSYIQIGATIIGNGFSFQPAMPVDPQGHVTGKNIAPGTYSFGGSFGDAGGTQGWWLRSAIANARDLLDQPITFAPGQALTDVVVTFSDKHNELSGVLSASSGAPASEYFVLVFSTDRSHWRAGSRRIVTVRPGSDGKFILRDVPAGTYFIAALEDLDAVDATDSKFLEQVVPAAIQVVVKDGEKAVQDLRIAR